MSWVATGHEITQSDRRHRQLWRRSRFFERDFLYNQKQHCGSPPGPFFTAVLRFGPRTPPAKRVIE